MSKSERERERERDRKKDNKKERKKGGKMMCTRMECIAIDSILVQ